jgi:hypothetical protein
MYEPLLNDGIRLLRAYASLALTRYPILIVLYYLDYIGAQDANCGWPGILSFVRHRPFPVLPWSDTS